MSTYTDLHMRRRENLTILRRPGSAEDGITPQRVIFANPENIYEGTFKGRIDAVSVSLSSVELIDTTINGGVIKDAVIYSDGIAIPVAELMSNVQEISVNLDDAVLSIGNFETSCTNLDSRINDLISGENGLQKISADVISILSGAADSTISSISSQLSTAIYTGLSVLDDKLSSQVSSISSCLSTVIDNFAYLSSELSDYHNTLSGIDRANDQHISSDNLILTDIIGSPVGSHSHQRYYMTFLSGTVVLKAISES